MGVSPTIETDLHVIVESGVKHHKANLSGAVVIVWYLDTQLRVQSVSITTMARCSRYKIKVCKCLWFYPGTPVSSTNKTDRNDIAEIVLKVALNTTTLTIAGSWI